MVVPERFWSDPLMYVLNPLSNAPIPSPSSTVVNLANPAFLTFGPAKVSLNLPAT